MDDSLLSAVVHAEVLSTLKISHFLGVVLLLRLIFTHSQSLLHTGCVYAEACRRGLAVLGHSVCVCLSMFMGTNSTDGFQQKHECVPTRFGLTCEWVTFRVPLAWT